MGLFSKPTDKTEEQQIDLNWSATPVVQPQDHPAVIGNKIRFGIADTRYKIAISTSLYFMGKQVSDSETESVWELSGSPEALDVQVLDRSVLKVDQQMVPLMEIIAKINRTSNYLKLSLHHDFSIANLLNQDFILKEWERIKFEELKIHELENPAFAGIISGYDHEFGDLNPSLQLNILYQLFFLPKGMLSFPVHEPQRIFKNKRTTSQLMPQQSIYYDLFYTSKYDDKQIIVTCNATLSPEWPQDKISNQYQQNYYELLQLDFKFEYSIEAQYTYDHDGTLLKATVYVKEQANEGLFAISRYHFSLIATANPTTL